MDLSAKHTKLVLELENRQGKGQGTKRVATLENENLGLVKKIESLQHEIANLKKSKDDVNFSLAVSLMKANTNLLIEKEQNGVKAVGGAKGSLQGLDDVVKDKHAYLEEFRKVEANYSNLQQEYDMAL